MLFADFGEGLRPMSLKSGNAVCSRCSRLRCINSCLKPSSTAPPLRRSYAPSLQILVVHVVGCDGLLRDTSRRAPDFDRALAYS